MKNKIFKVCALGLVTAVLFTGCQKKEGKVNKIQKNEEFTYSEKTKLEDNNYYGIELYQYTSKTQLEADYEYEKENFLQREDVVNVNALTKNNNVYEAIVTIDSDDYVDKIYEYMLLVKNSNDYVVLYQQSINSNKEEVIKIGNELKGELKNSKDYLKTFNDYAKKNNLSIGVAYGNNGIETRKTALLATNLKQKDYVDTNDKVVSVSENYYQLTANTGKLVVEAKTSDGKLVWSIDRGSIPVGIGLEGIVSEQVGDLFLMSTHEAVEARDIQTSKVVWTADIHSAVTHSMIKSNNKIFDIQGDIVCGLEVKDYSTGKTIYYTDDISKYVVRNANEEYDYYTIVTESAKVDNDYIVYDVIDQDKDDTKVGKLKINTNDYKIVFER